ncbi:NADH kinase pos5 [Coemansia spiralis]|uniref:NADH kinase pos5 n=2 Tax=Coemansia TaxID=4863 RepID=A0A9W8KY55_9FUNG|nr:ATP-NAD kinase-like domain-containing protein [Coemansia spiralis]KAJ1991408.1 NADH kinase pos5 [Coemansia umbellata]KAJ2624934.1 NADH kinase pos5 [Coemansia sp. RSA 1358]KAJ2679158.1 NADH kinase pos5 [Coemansia spiralis]
MTCVYAGSARSKAVGRHSSNNARALATTADIPSKILPKITRRASASSIDGFEGDADQQFSLEWQAATPKTVLIVKKADDRQVDNALVSISKWIHKTYPQINVVLEPPVYRQMHETLPFVRTIPPSCHNEYTRVVDFVITLGGDGTFLHVSSLFQEQVPPIIPFSMGTLGFLLPFNVADFPKQLQKIIEGTSTVLPRMRLAYSKCKADGSLDKAGLLSITNEACIHRGTYPHLTTISCYLNDHLLTTSVGDGIIVGTPTGSTAYSLSAGGPIVHPLVSSMLVAPVCPRSLSFRPLMLPSSSVVKLQVHRQSRGRATAFIDGRDCGELLQGECIEIKRSQYPLMCVNRDDLAAGWAQDINQLLKFNRTFSYPHETPFDDHPAGEAHGSDNT